MKSAEALRRERRIAWIVVAFCVPVALLGTAARFAVTQHVVPTIAMSPTIHRHDQVLVNRAAYVFGKKPRAGDVVAFRDKKLNIFRVVAGPGTTIEMRDNVVFVDGKRLHEPYTILTPDVPAMRSFAPRTVPAGHYFLLGDNRDNANDSRFRGPIAEKQIVGRMVYVLHIGRCRD